MAIRKSKCIKRFIVTGLVVSLMSPSMALASTPQLTTQEVVATEVNTSNVYKVIKNKITVKEKHNYAGKKIGELSAGDIVKVLEVGSKYSKIEYKDQIGYIKNGDIQEITPQRTIDTDKELIVVSENYKVKKTVKVMNNKTLKGKSLGEIKAGEIITVLSEKKDAGKISYNGKYGYVDMRSLEYVSSNVNNKYGVIVVKYLDAETKEEIEKSETYSNLKYDDKYSYTAKDIVGYTVKGDNQKEVNLTLENSPYELVFEYERENNNDNSAEEVPVQKLGEITINYIEKSTGDKISDSAYYKELELKEYEYLAKDIEGYSLVSDSVVKVTIDEKNLVQVVDFIYEKNVVEEVVPPQENENKNVNMNEVPYISTYYIKPIVKPGEEVRLDYYVTDYHQKENRDGDSDETFTVTVKVDGRTDIVKKNVKPGDNTINLGSFDKEGEQKFSIIATDKYGRNSHELFNFFLVGNDTKVKEYKMTEEDLKKYNIKNNDNYKNETVWVDIASGTSAEEIDRVVAAKASELNPKSKTYDIIRIAINGEKERNSLWKHNKVVYSKDYDKEAVLNESRTTKEGLQKLILDKKAEGFNKVTLLPGKYRIDHEKAIFIPSDMTLDLNGATVKLNQFTGDKAVMITINGEDNAHLTNGIIEGDYYEHDYANSPNNSEWVNGIELANGSTYSSFSNLVIRDITGYGVASGISGTTGLDGKGYLEFISGKLSGFAKGDIDRTTGEPIASDTRTTSDFKDISKSASYDYLSVSRYLGYQGLSGGTWNIICHFYDADKNYIESIDAYQYRRVSIPEGAKFLKVTLLSTETPEDLSVQGFTIPTHSKFSGLTIENARCVGMAQAQMKDFLVEDCEISYSGQSGAFCAYDAEDGWDMMQDVTFRRFNFHDNYRNDFLTCAGHNFVVEDMVQGDVYIWERTNSFVYRNNKESARGNITLRVGSRTRSGYNRTTNNVINGNISVADAGGLANSWSMVIRNNKINGRASNDLGVGKYVDCEIGEAYNAATGSTWDTALGVGEFENCYVHDKKGENQGGIYRNCKIENISGNMHRQLRVENSEIKNLKCNLWNYDPEISVKDSKLTNMSINFSYWYQGGIINIDNCDIENDDYLLRLPHYAMKKPVTIKNNKFTTSGTNGMVWFYDDRTGGQAGELVEQDKVTLEGNTITMENSKYIVNGLSKAGQNNINIISKDNVYDEEKLELCNPEARECEAIKITE